MAENQITYIDNIQGTFKLSGDTLFQARKSMSDIHYQVNRVYVSIMVIAYNRLEKTRRCIESIIENTINIDYQLVLIDNGSTDGTLEYFKGVICENKRIISIKKNAGLQLALTINSVVELGRYFVLVPNDVIVTPNWLKNMLLCAQSDEKIGMVCAASSNVSNLQEVKIDFGDYNDMMEKARNYNQSDPSKWQERLRLVTILTLLKKEVLLAVGYPFFDCGFYHDYSDDDLSFRIRRSGYKVVLAGDVWVYHDHDYRNLEDKKVEDFQHSLENGRKNFQEKYHEIDAWEDVNNYIIDAAKYIRKTREKKNIKILGIDVKCGTPILDIKNKIREFGCYDAKLSAFTQDARYQTDLKTICEDIVACDRQEFLRDNLPENFYDYIVLGHPINMYNEPQKIINDLLSLAKKEAQIIIPLYNTFSFYEYLNILGDRSIYNSQFSYNISLETLKAILENQCQIDGITMRQYQLGTSDITYIKNSIEKKMQTDECLQRLMAETFWFTMTKI